MDPVGFAIGVIGLYGLAKGSVDFVINVYKADETVKVARNAISLQRQLLDAWAENWGVSAQLVEAVKKYEERKEEQKRVNSSKGKELRQEELKVEERKGIELRQKLVEDITGSILHWYIIDSPIQFAAMIFALDAIGEIFTQFAERLQEKDIAEPPSSESSKAGRHGFLRVSREDLKQMRESLKNRLQGVENNVKWVAAGQERFEGLMKELEFCINALWRLDNLAQHIRSRSEFQRAVLNQPGALTVGETREAVKLLSTTITTSAGGETSGGWQKLNELLEIQKSIEKEHGSLHESEIMKLQKPFDDGNIKVWEDLSMAVSAAGDDPKGIWVEFKSYLDDQPKANKEIKKDLITLGRLLTNASSGTLFGSLLCVGLFDDSKKSRIGYGYELPRGIGGSPLSTKRALPSAPLIAMRPFTLETALHSHKVRPLGERFDLAKRIVANVTALHAVGWLHKNICPSSIHFFRKDPREGRNSDIMWSEPFLMGWDVSRSDQLNTETVEESEDSNASSQDEGYRRRVRREGDSRAGAQNELVKTGPRHQGRLSVKTAERQRRLEMEWAGVSNDPVAMRHDSVGNPEEVKVKGRARLNRVVNRESSRERESKPQKRNKTEVKTQKRLNKLSTHPSKLNAPESRYEFGYDIYSLGLVLLQIGLWKPISQIIPEDLLGVNADSSDYGRIPEHVMSSTEEELVVKCGERYNEVVQECLSVQPGDLVDTKVEHLKNLNEWYVSLNDRLTRYCIA